MLNNLSKDKSGAPVKWKFNKSGVKQANKVGKRLATAQEKDLTSQGSLPQSTMQKKETKNSKPTDVLKKSDNKDGKTEEIIVKRKPGRPKLVKSEKQSDLASVSNVSIDRLNDNKVVEPSTEVNEKDDDSISIGLNSNLNEKPDLSLSEGNTHKTGSKQGKRNTILSKNIRIKRLEILKRHIERGKGKGRSGIKRIREYRSATPVSDTNSETLPDEMNEQSTVSNNQDKLKMLKEQIDSERRRGRGRGNLRRGRGRWKSFQDSDVNESSFSAGSSQYQDVHAGDDSILKTEATQLEMLKLQVGQGNSHRGRRGRPKWKHLNIGNRTNEGTRDADSFSAENQNLIGNSAGRFRGARGRGPTWTSLNRQTLNKLVLNEHTKQAVCSGTLSLVNQLNDNNLIDSENESIDSNLSSVSSKARKRKMFHLRGIKLGPAKLLRSQDSMKTRNYKDLNAQRVPKKRKRTLSGEFELLDEVSLRKQMRGKDDDDSSTIRSFDDSWADMTDSELTDSRLDFTKGDYEQKNDSGNKCTKVKTKSDETIDRDDLQKGKVILNKKSLTEKDVKTPRKKGRPPKILSKKYKTEVKVKKKDFINTKHPFISRNTTGRLTIIGPGGKYFVKIKNPPSDENEIILGNELDGVGVNENIDTDSSKDTAVKSELKKEVKIEDIKDDYTKENEVVIKVVIENSEIIDSQEEQETSVEPTKREDNVSIQSVDNAKEDYSMETENTRETINMSLKHVTHENNHDNKDTLNSKDRLLKQSENLDRADSLKNIDSEQQSEQNSLKVQDSVLEEKSPSVGISTKECNNDFSSSIKTQNLANELEKQNPSDENITGKNDSVVNKCVLRSSNEVENKIEEKMEINGEISVEDAHRVNNVASVDTNEVSSASNVGRSATSKTVNQSEPPPVTNGDEIKNLSIDEQVLHQGNSEQLENNKRPDVVESEKLVSSSVSVAKLDNTELNEPSDYNVKGTESVVMEVLEHLLVNVCGKLDSKIVNDVQGTSHILGNDEEKTELSGTNIDIKESLTDSKIVSEVSSMPDQSDNEGINKINMENNPELTLEKESLTKNTEEEKFVQRNINAEKNKDKMENDIAAVISDRTEINISEKPGQSFFTVPSDDIVLNNKLKETCDNDFEIDSIEIKNQEEKNGPKPDINMVETSDKEAKTLELESKENREDEMHRKTVEIVVNDTEADENVGMSDNLMDESTPMEPETCDSQVKRKRKNELESDSKSGMLEPELQDSNTASPEAFGKTETKRVFQLRKKASRSPLEIIAMKHSMEERQYMLEETQRAIRREEKQKKMFQNKLLRQTIEQLSPPKQMEHGSPPKPTSEHMESVSPEKSEVFTLEPIHQCRPCSVVLIDFVKYLKMNENSEKCDTVPDIDELSTTEEEPMTESESSEKLELDPMNKDTNLIDDTNVMLDNATPSLPQGNPPPIKRPATARKQAKSYNYSAKLTAEIVSSPEPTESGSKSFMVPPLRLKIKQKEKGKRRYKGHKWTASRNKARKQMSPTKSLIPREQFEFETLGLKEGGYEISPTPDKVVKLDGMKDASKGKTISDPSTSENTNFQMPLDGNNVYRFKCRDKNCDFKSQMRNIMESHIYIHINDVPFKCFHCELIYSNRNMAFNHSKKIHPDKEPKIIAVVPVEESNFYEEINVPQGADNSNVIQADIQDVQHSSESLIISVRLPRNINDSSTGCFCCCHCDYSSSKVPDINAHVEERHRELIQYICSVCNEAVYRHGEGIAKHFSVEHPDQPVAYKSLPDFYDVRKTIEKSLTNGDKGNIFERMSDLFAGKKNRGTGSQSNSVPEKTSAEADSTTMETDEEMAAATTQRNTPPVGGKTVVPVHREPDGIEQLAQMFGSSSSNEMGRCTTDSNRYFISFHFLS